MDCSFYNCCWDRYYLPATPTSFFVLVFCLFSFSPTSTILRSSHAPLLFAPQIPQNSNLLHKHNLGFMPCWTSFLFCYLTLSQIWGSHGNAVKVYKYAGSQSVKGFGLPSSKPQPKVSHSAHFQRQSQDAYQRIYRIHIGKPVRKLLGK